jgi:hypothetical protein
LINLASFLFSYYLVLQNVNELFFSLLGAAKVITFSILPKLFFRNFKHFFSANDFIISYMQSSSTSIPLSQIPPMNFALKAGAKVNKVLFLANETIKMF